MVATQDEPRIDQFLKSARLAGAFFLAINSFFGPRRRLIGSLAATEPTKCASRYLSAEAFRPPPAITSSVWSGESSFSIFAKAASIRCLPLATC